MTARPTVVLESFEHIARLEAEGALVANAADLAGFDRDVPSCPQWTVRELVRHLGGVHRWATSIVALPRTTPWNVELDDVVGRWPTDTELLDWFRIGHRALVTALRSAPSDLDCWTFVVAPTPLVMWARRQAHETTVHRIDAELAADLPLTPVDSRFAADGIDELLRCFVLRPSTPLRSELTCVLEVGCDDVDAVWRVRIGPDGVTVALGGGEPDCRVVGAAPSLYRLLWQRGGRKSCAVDGDAAVFERFLDTVHIEWS